MVRELRLCNLCDMAKIKHTHTIKKKKLGREVGGGSGWGTLVNPWLIHANVWEKPLQYCKVISLQLIKITEKKTKTNKQKNLRSWHLILSVNGK